MKDYFLLFLTSTLIDNCVLVKFLGLCPFMGISKKLETTISIGFSTTFIMTLTIISSWLINTFILIPLNLLYLRTLIFILVISFIVQFTEIIVRKSNPKLYLLLGIFSPSITTNCVILSITLLNINQSYNFLQSAFYGFSASIGFSLVIILFTAIRNHLESANIPVPFRGSPISFITVGLMSLSFMGFNNLVKF
ncbi:MAG: electron transport complex subunit RsxA [Arsenophonus endosymbiont of Ceratovacuna japonica]